MHRRIGLGMALGLTLAAAPLMAQPGGPGGPGREGPPRGEGERERERPPGPRGEGVGPYEGRMIAVGYLGVAAAEVSPELTAQLGLPRGVGLSVIHVQPDSPAAAAGLQQHDVLHKLDDQVLVNTEQLRTLVQNKTKGDAVTLTLFRQAKSMQVTATVGQTEAPEHRGRPMMGFPGRGMPDDDMGLRPFRMERREGDDRGGPPRERPEGAERGPREPGPRGERPDGPPERERVREQTTATRASAGTARYKDDDHVLAVTMTDGKKTLVASDTAGNELFNGPIDTPDQRAAVPEAIRAKLDKLETMRPQRMRDPDMPPREGPPHERPL